MKKLLILPLLALSACATVTASSQQEIPITTIPAGARCVLSNSENAVTLEKTPGVVTVKRAFEPLKVECTRGTRKASGTLEPVTRGRAYGNILLLGVPALVDAHTGAGYRYDPESVTLELR